jgi:hypothetical protein
MKVSNHSAATSIQCSHTIVFATATGSAIGSDTGNNVNTAATILMFVAVLATFACTRVPFKSKLIFGKFHDGL